MTNILALQVDPLRDLNLQTDSSLALAFEAQSRGYKVFTYQPYSLVYRQEKFWATGLFIELRDEGTSYVASDESLLNLEEVSVILIRQDPPFDQRYMANTYLLELLEKRVKIINSPKGMRSACEKVLPLQFPDFIPSTIITEKAQAIYDFAREFESVIIKPLFAHGGRGVLKLERPSLSHIETLLNLYHSSFPGPLVVQEYLKEIVKGDKRILLIKGDPVAVFKRVPREGDIRSNLVQGGTAEACCLSKKDLDICAALKPTLQHLGLYLVGLDVIGDYLMEVNVTSPTGLRAVEALYGIDVAKVFWDEL